jgi:hypothetical protein
MGSDERDEQSTHTFQPIGVAALRLVTKLKTQLRMKGPDAEAPGKSGRKRLGEAPDAHTVEADMREAEKL